MVNMPTEPVYHDYFSHYPAHFPYVSDPGFMRPFGALVPPPSPCCTFDIRVDATIKRAYVKTILAKYGTTIPEGTVMLHCGGGYLIESDKDYYMDRKHATDIPDVTVDGFTFHGVVLDPASPLRYDDTLDSMFENGEVIQYVQDFDDDHPQTVRFELKRMTVARTMGNVTLASPAMIAHRSIRVGDELCGAWVRIG